jgi:hypothetical protein
MVLQLRRLNKHHANVSSGLIKAQPTSVEFRILT